MLIEQLNIKKYTLMVVDDSPTILKIVNRALQEKYEIVSAESGEEAMKIFDSIIPDLILLDVEMPNLSGFETIKLIKQDRKLRDIPVIFLTAKNDVEFELEALGLGAVDYINKPFANPLLIKRVELHISLAMQQKVLTNYNQNLQQMVDEKTQIIKELQYAIVFTLAELVEMRDGSTGGHVLRTQNYFDLILQYLEENNIYQDILSKIDNKLLLEASQLHDIGKVAIPDAILLKPARLDYDEFEIMKTHTVIGYNAILKAMELTSDKEFLNFAAVVAISHHEKWDGSGYPNGTKGEDIPVAGRIMAIVDVYDAIVSERPYKKAMSHEQAMGILRDGRGNHFDPVLVDAVVAIGEKLRKLSSH